MNYNFFISNGDILLLRHAVLRLQGAGGRTTYGNKAEFVELIWNDGIVVELLIVRTTNEVLT